MSLLEYAKEKCLNHFYTDLLNDFQIMSQSKVEPPAFKCDAWNKSTVGDVTFTYVWQIDQYNLRSKQRGVAWFSTPFNFEGVDGKVSQWEIKYFPLGKEVEIFLIAHVKGNPENM